MRLNMTVFHATMLVVVLGLTYDGIRYGLADAHAVRGPLPQITQSSGMARLPAILSNLEHLK